MVNPAESGRNPGIKDRFIRHSKQIAQGTALGTIIFGFGVLDSNADASSNFTSELASTDIPNGADSLSMFSSQIEGSRVFQGRYNLTVLEIDSDKYPDPPAGALYAVNILKNLNSSDIYGTDTDPKLSVSTFYVYDAQNPNSNAANLSGKLEDSLKKKRYPAGLANTEHITEWSFLTMIAREHPGSTIEIGTNRGYSATVPGLTNKDLVSYEKSGFIFDGSTRSEDNTSIVLYGRLKSFPTTEQITE